MGHIDDLRQKFPNQYITIIFALILTMLLNLPKIGEYDLVIYSLFVSIFTTIIVEAIAVYIKREKKVLETAIVTSLVITNIIKPGEYQLIAVASVLAILLKHLIRFNNSPIFNPATLGLFIALRLVVNPITKELWWGNYNTIAIIILGFLVAWRIRKLLISFSYLIVYTAIAYFQIGQQAFSFFPFFSAFFMLTEPKTSPMQINKQIIFGAFAAIAIQFFIILNLPSVYLLGILAANLFKIVLNKF